MTIAFIADAVHVYGLASRLNDQRKDGAFCDVLLKVSGQTLPTHSCVLSACSPFFQGLICGDRATPNNLIDAAQEIELDTPGMVGPLVGLVDGGLEAMIDMLDYIYTGKIELKAESVDLVVQLADTFMLDGLASQVRTFMEDYGKVKSSEEGEEAGAVPVPPTLTTTLPDTIGSPPKPPKTRKRRKIKKEGGGETSGSGVNKQLQQRKRRSIFEENDVNGPDISQLDWGRDADEVDDDEDDGANSDTNAEPSRPLRKKYKFKCMQCDFSSGDQQAVREHKLLHPGRSYKCVTCGFLTGLCSKLLTHLLESEHSETECSLCGSVSPDPESLKEHLLRHDHPKSFFCELCEMRFTSRSLLLMHVLKHTSERPFSCDVCHNAFKSKHCLQKHMLCHATEKGFLCDQCDFRTAYKGTLKMHLRIHNGDMFKCPQEGCSFQATRNQIVQEHMATHTEQKPYVCDVCGHKFAFERRLRQHAKKHNQEAYMLHCNQCDFKTLRRYRLTEHLRKSHTDGIPGDEL